MPQVLPFPASWINRCIMSDGKKPVPLSNYTNAMIALRSDGGLQHAIGYDEFCCCPSLLHPIGAPDGNARPRMFTDKDAGDVQEYLQRAGLKTIARQTVDHAIESYAHEHPFHPVREWIEAEPWDGTFRLRTWLSVYAGAEPGDYSAEVGEMFLIQLVARVFDPGCKADYMLVLEGAQGEEKSKVALTLVGEEWFSDSLPDIGKDASLHLIGKWLIEDAEMDVMSRAENKRRKAFISRTVERYRRPYGHFEVTEKRQCVFFGTTNTDDYLHDETGGRRWWPIRQAHPIAIEALAKDRRQLFAEALFLYREGKPWWPERQLEKTLIAPEQDARQETDPWEPTIEEYLVGRTRVSVSEIATHALFIQLRDYDARVQSRIAKVLRRLRWTRGRLKDGRFWNAPSILSIP